MSASVICERKVDLRTPIFNIFFLSFNDYIWLPSCTGTYVIRFYDILTLIWLVAEFDGSSILQAERSHVHTVIIFQEEFKILNFAKQKYTYKYTNK